MSYNIHPASALGRLGQGLGRGLSEQIPKEIERYRLASGLKKLGEQKNLDPFEQFAGLASIPGAVDRPQLLQTAGDLLRQKAIINSINQNQEPISPISKAPFERSLQGSKTATTPESTEAALNPYIPPSGPEQEEMARRLMAVEPRVYTTIESARSAITNQVAANTQQSNARLAKRELEESVQSRSEQKLRDELKTIGAEIPGTVLSNLQQKAVDDVTSKKLSPDAAKIKYGKEANQISQDFSNIRSWGSLSLITKNSKDLINSISALQKNAKENGYQKQAADSLIAENGLTPQFAYASLYPVSDIKDLNNELKSLPNIQPKIEKAPGIPGLAGIGKARPKNADADKLTLQVAPRLARSMGVEGSPLSISYELEKKGYNPQVWKQYLLDNQDQLNLTSHQKDELQKPRPSFFGWLNDWWLSSFSGVK